MGITIIEGAMNSTAKGSAKERLTAKLLSEDGWLVASRRHIGGAADLLAIKPNHRPRLVEVKCRRELYSGSGFSRADRAALIAEAERFDAEPLCAWWKPRAREPVWLGVGDWPS